MEHTKGVYCVDISIKASPISMRSRLPKINKTIRSIPLALDDDLNPVRDVFIHRFIKEKDINSYDVDYSITNKRFMSNLCYDI
jgi:hypothetical protein